MVISGGSGAFLEGLEWLGSWHKRQGLMQNLEIFSDFSGILEGLGWFRT
jgi:hypothetical protein